MGPEPIPGCKTLGTHIWGWMTIPELEWLYAQAKTMNSIVEVGSLRGRSAYALAMGCKGKVHCIDPFDDARNQCEAAFMENVGYLSNVHTIKGLSPAAAREVRGRVDMVFIDGDHSREGITADIDRWLPKTNKLICGHDYSGHPDAGYPDVKAVVDERFAERVTVAPDTSIWAVRL